MKKQEIIRYDLDKVYFLNEYNETVAYGNANINIDGVKEQLQNLEKEKIRYFEEVAGIVDPERKNEEMKYQKYEKWVNTDIKCKRAEVLLIFLLIVWSIVFKYLPIVFRTSLLFTLFNVLLNSVLILCVLVVGPLILIVANIAKHSCGIQYQKYTESVSSRLNNMGNDFIRISVRYYEAIDNLYLLSLDPAHREMVLMRRDQERQRKKREFLYANRLFRWEMESQVWIYRFIWFYQWREIYHLKQNYLWRHLYIIKRIKDSEILSMKYRRGN